MSLAPACPPLDRRTTFGYDAVVQIQPRGKGMVVAVKNFSSRMTRLENPQNERTTWTYDNLGRATQQQLGNDSKATYTYDSAGQLTRLANFTSSNTMISSFDYNYDAAGNRTRVIESTW